MPRLRKAAGLSFAFLGGLFVGCLLLVLAVRLEARHFWQRTHPLAPPVVKVDLSRPTVIARIQQLAKLETVTYTMDKVVEGDEKLPYLPNFLAGDKLVLVAQGQAIAGVDLAKLTANNVSVSGKSVRVQLPPAELLSVALDDSKTHVYTRQTGILMPADPDLESRVRAKAQEDLRKSALQAGILATAHTNACKAVTSLLGAMGFDQVSCS